MHIQNILINKYMNHLVKDKKIFKKYLKIWNKIKILIKKRNKEGTSV